MTSSNQILRNKINNHPLFQLPKEERNKNQPLRSDLIALVMQLKEFDKKIEKRLTLEDEMSASLEDEQELEWARVVGIKRNGKYMDTLAFMESINRAIASFDTKQGAEFLAYFDKSYAHALYRSSNSSLSNSTGITMSAEQRTLYKKLSQLCEQQFHMHINDLSQTYYQQLAKQLHTSTKQIEQIISIASIVRNTISIDTIVETEEGKTSINFADTSFENMQHKQDIEVDIIESVTAFADLDTAEYPRIFFTNDTLHPMFDAKQKSNQQEYCEVIEKHETVLWKTIFDNSYIEFVFLPPPTLNCTQNLLRAKQQYKLNDTTIAKYKGVGKDAISKQRKKYKNVLTAIWNKIQDC